MSFWGVLTEQRAMRGWEVALSFARSMDSIALKRTMEHMAADETSGRVLMEDRNGRLKTDLLLQYLPKIGQYT